MNEALATYSQTYVSVCTFRFETTMFGNKLANLRVKCKSADALFNWSHCYRDFADKTLFSSQLSSVAPVILGNTP